MEAWPRGGTARKDVALTRGSLDKGRLEMERSDPRGQENPWQWEASTRGDVEKGMCGHRKEG